MKVSEVTARDARDYLEHYGASAERLAEFDDGELTVGFTMLIDDSCVCGFRRPIYELGGGQSLRLHI